VHRGLILKNFSISTLLQAQGRASCRGRERCHGLRRETHVSLAGSLQLSEINL
jgi:hypothetical protein